MKKIALILAGGKGTRLWPLSRENYPKQFVELEGGFSSFQITLKRLSRFFSPENIFVVVPEDYKFTARNQVEFFSDLPQSSRKIISKNIILEPLAKNTLGAVLFFMRWLGEKYALNPGDLVYVFPSDHRIEPLTTFVRGLGQAARQAKRGRIVLFGIRPDSAKREYGYALTGASCEGGFRVSRFVEKPSLLTAKRLVRQGAYWNSGMFCFAAKTLLSELKLFWPGIFRSCQLPFEAFLEKYRTLPALSMDRAIMQKTRNAVLIPLNVSWLDLVSWDQFLGASTNGQKNHHIGKAKFLGSKNCFTYSRGRLMCVVGLKDVMAIDSADSLLLVKRGSSDKVKELVWQLAREGYTHDKDGLTVYRPWGYYTILHQGPDYKVKEIGIYPGRSLSLQKHHRRSEHWNVVEGEVQVLVEGVRKSAGKNESIFVPRGAKHRIYNPKTKIAKIIEVQIGKYLGEDDIVRFSAYE